MMLNQVVTYWGLQWGSSGALFQAQFSVIFANKPDAGFKCILSKFGDDTKLGRAVDCLEGKEALQKHFDKLDTGQSPITRSSTRAISGFCGWARATLDMCADQGIRGWRAAPRKEIWGFWSMARQQCALAAKSTKRVLGYIQHSKASWSREVNSFTLFSTSKASHAVWSVAI